MSLRIVLLFFVGFSFASCKDHENVVANDPLVNDLQQYLNSEIRELEQSNFSLKTVLVNQDIPEEKSIADPDWKNELKPLTVLLTDRHFKSSLFVIDSMEVNNVFKYKMHARDEYSEIKSVTVYKSKNAIDSLIIIRSVSNMYYVASDTVHYKGHGNLEMRTTNIPAVGKPIRFLLQLIAQPA
jgi:hypothetical protein